MKMQAKIAALVMALTVAVSPVSAAAEWQQDPYQNWQWTENGVPVTGWEFINQNWYCFDANGYMLTGWQKIEGKQYYFNANGTLAVGWTQVDGNWYYMNGSGEMLTGWQRVEGYWYYLNSQGVMQKGWLDYGRDHYYLDENGAMEIGWVEVDGDWYFMNHDGLLQTGLIEVNGEVFYLDGNGKMLTGKQTIAGTSYQFDAETGAATGSKKPQPGKAFDAFGNEAEVTVENAGGSSGGTTVIYVPTQSGDSGSSGNQGGWDDDWDDDWDDGDDDNPGWNPGGDDGDDDGDIPSGETPEPVEGDLAELDEFFASMVPQINADYGRDFNVSFDKESHVITVSIKNLEKRITNIWYGNLLHDLVDYKNGIVTAWKINNGTYRELYRVYKSDQGSIYHNPVYFSKYYRDFVNAGLNVFSSTEVLIGRSAQVTLRLGDYLETSPYTVNFEIAQETIADDPTCKMAVYRYETVVDESGGRPYNTYVLKEYVDCEEISEGVKVYYHIPDGDEYTAIRTYGDYQDQYQLVELLNFVPRDFTGFDCHVTHIGDTYTATSKDGSYSIRFDPDSFTYLGLNLSDFYYNQYIDRSEVDFDVIGAIYTRKESDIKTSISTKIYKNGPNYIGGESRFTEKGLEISLPINPTNDVIYDINMDFDPPIQIDGQSVSRINLSDIDGKNSLSGDLIDYLYYASYGYHSDLDSESYRFNNRAWKENTRTFNFRNFSLDIILEDSKIIIPKLTSNTLENTETSIEVDLHEPFTYSGRSQSSNMSLNLKAEWENGLVITNSNGLRFDNEEVYLDFYYPVKIGGVSIAHINVDRDSYRHELYIGASYLNWNQEVQYFENAYYVDDGLVRTYYFEDTDAYPEVNFEFRVEISEDGSQITFPDLSEDMLVNNSVGVQVDTE